MWYLDVSDRLAREYANEARLELGLGLDGISNVTEVLESNGVKIIEIDEAESFGGLSGLADGSIPVIVINKKLSSENKRFTLLHEFAHILLDFDETIGVKTVEAVCNAFALELLLPSSVLTARVGTKRHDISLAELKDLQMQYGVSLDRIMIALRNMGIITDRRYVTYLKKKKNFPAFNDSVEKSLSLPESSRRFVRMVYRAIADDIISFSKAAALLNTSIETVKAQFQLI
ncbi:MAG: ImmA/IrrE family metallo-endopeptidase [Muribaculaceae bacterium]|nr:ImmA/IrrE family metallo-endopeptidase [Muribaculaceae bacterium]